MPLISIVTPAAPTASPYISEAAASLRDLQPVEGFEVEWIVVADGDPCDDKDALIDAVNAFAAVAPLDVRLLVNPYRAWAGFSRNRGLVHANSEHVATLDADDTLTVDALQFWAEHIVERPQISWCSYAMVDLLPDGTLREAPHGFNEGPLPAGAWFRTWQRTRRHPRCPVSVLWKKDVLVEAGGWSAAPIAQDAHPVFWVTSKHDGWCSHQVTQLYRLHAAQTSAPRLPDSPLWGISRDALMLAERTAEALLRERDTTPFAG